MNKWRERMAGGKKKKKKKKNVAALLGDVGLWARRIFRGCSLMVDGTLCVLRRWRT